VLVLRDPGIVQLSQRALRCAGSCRLSPRGCGVSEKCPQVFTSTLCDESVLELLLEGVRETYLVE
jgi:hypothetical protein